MFSEIKKKSFSNQKQIQLLPEKLIESEQIEPEQIESEQIEPVFVQIKSEEIKPVEKNNKLITCYEEDYTRNANEIMKLWQRN
jgi:hypothetical protein